MKKARERERKVLRRRKNRRDSGSSWIVGEKERGGMSPMAATHHSQLNDAIFFPFLPSFPWEGVEGEGVRPAPNQTGSYRVHTVQVGLHTPPEECLYAVVRTVWMRSEMKNGGGGL